MSFFNQNLALIHIIWCLIRILILLKISFKLKNENIKELNSEIPHDTFQINITIVKQN